MVVFMFANGGKTTGPHQPAFMLEVALGVRHQTGKSFGKLGFVRLGQPADQLDEFAVGGVHALHPEQGEAGGGVLGVVVGALQQRGKAAPLGAGPPA